MTSQDHTREEQGTGPVIRDRRRIDPATGQVREQSSGTSPGKHARGPAGPGADPGAAAPPPPEGTARPTREEAPDKADMPEMTTQLAERTADLQRLQAEYANYRKRVERDRLAVREQALANVLAELLPVLDDVGRAREHGELSGGFKSVADVLEATVTKLGLVRYGEPGEGFDPNVHEALLHSYSDEVSEPTCVQILQAGYKVGDRILRPARVAVAEPGEGPGDDAGGSPAPGDQSADQPPEPPADPETMA
jgi:molecular chaperone GrpE